jgi:hypothetical protein
MSRCSIILTFKILRFAELLHEGVFAHVLSVSLVSPTHFNTLCITILGYNFQGLLSVLYPLGKRVLTALNKPFSRRIACIHSQRANPCHDLSKWGPTSGSWDSQLGLCAENHPEDCLTPGLPGLKGLQFIASKILAAL